MTALATLEDVNRILKFTTGDNPERDEQLEGALAAVSSLMVENLRDFSAGRNIKTYNDIPVGSTVSLPTPDCTVVAVRCDDEFITNYEVTAEGALILRTFRFWPGWNGGWGSGWSDGQNVGPFANFQDFGSDRGAERVWRKVEVFYIGSGVIPAAVTEGVAFLTAGYWTSGPQALGGMFQEKIGDYSYQRTAPRAMPGQEPEYVETAMRFLSRFFKGSRVSVT